LDQKLIHFEKTEKGMSVRLTQKGKDKLGQLTRGDMVVKKPKRWDKRWRLVIFDIKEHRKYTRDQLRDTLVRLGFLRLQNSVWVFPYDCEDLIVLLKADFEIGKDVLYIIAEKIENDTALKEYFGLG
jgi:CRISPR-associated endonuclease Cas2